MKTQISQENRRLAILCHYAAVLALMILMYLFIWDGRLHGWMIVSTVVLLVVAYISFRLAHTGTGLWSFVWSKSEQLDERELQLTRETFHKAYRIFVATAIAAVVIVAILNKSYLSQEAYLQKRPFNAAPLLLALVHFAKTLPSSILAWTEREVYRQ